MKEKNWLGTVLTFASECRWKMIFSVLCAVISVVGGIVPYIGVYQIIISFFNGSKTIKSIVFWSMVCLAGYIVKLIFYAISTMLAHFSAYTILESMRLKIADRLMKTSLGTVLNQPVGKLKNVIIDRVETIELPLAHLIPEGISNLLLPIVVFVYIIMIDWRMALAAMVTVPIAVIAYGIMMKTFNKQYKDYMESSNYVNSVVVEYVEGIEVIKAFNRSSSSYEKFEKAVESFKAYTLNWFESTWKLMNFGGAVLPSTLLGTMPIGMYLYINGSLSPANLTMCLILSLGIVAPLTSFTVFVNEIKVIEYAVKDAYEFLNLKELKNSLKPVNLNKYDIEFKNVYFSYDTDKDDNLNSKEKDVLNNINLKIPQGSFSALVGPSGSGKSTICSLIARFYDVDKGAVSVGGINVKEMTCDSLLKNISMVFQKVYLFHDTVLNNIRFGKPEATFEEVVETAKKACCHDFIMNLPNGYETIIGDGGSTLSGGEKQRISIARAMLKDSPIVILDEATASIDPENEHAIQKAISTLVRGKTIIIIAHRLATIENADQILVIDEGHIVQRGTHEELIKEKGVYKRFLDIRKTAEGWMI